MLAKHKLDKMEKEEEKWMKKTQMHIEDAEGLIGTLRVDNRHKIKWQKEDVDYYLKWLSYFLIASQGKDRCSK